METVRPKNFQFGKKNVYTDLARQFFNFEVSIDEFRKTAAELDTKSFLSRKKCRQHLIDSQKKAAWNSAKRALYSQKRSLMFYEAAEKLTKLLATIKKENNLDPILHKHLQELDFAVRANDPARTKDILEALEEEMGFEREIQKSSAEQTLTEEDVAYFVNRQAIELEILQGFRTGSFNHSSNKSHLSSEILNSENQSKLKENFSLKKVKKETKKGNKIQVKKISNITDKRPIRFQLPKD